MDEYFGNAGIGGPNGILNLMRDPMPFAHGQISINQDMNTHVNLKPHLAYGGFVEPPYPGQGCGNTAYILLDSGLRRRVSQFGHRGNQQPIGVDDNNSRRHQGGPIVRAFISGSTNERDGDAHKGNRGRDCIAAMMPRVGLDRSTLNRLADADNVSKQHFLDQDNRGQNKQRESRGSMVRDPDLTYALDRYCNRGPHQGEGHYRRGNWLRFAMSVGVILVGRPHRDMHADEDDQ